MGQNLQSRLISSFRGFLGCRRSRGSPHSISLDKGQPLKAARISMRRMSGRRRGRPAMPRRRTAWPSSPGLGSAQIGFPALFARPNRLDRFLRSRRRTAQASSVRLLARAFSTASFSIDFDRKLLAEAIALNRPANSRSGATGKALRAAMRRSSSGFSRKSIKRDLARPSGNFPRAWMALSFTSCLSGRRR